MTSSSVPVSLLFVAVPVLTFFLRPRPRLAPPHQPSGGGGAQPQIHKLVLTGGPCGGKTTALARLSSYLQQRGYQVYTVPEASTMLLTNGCSPQFFAKEGWGNVFQESLLKIQVALEDNFTKVAAATGVKSVILCDRGLMDGSAYMSKGNWSEQLSRLGLSEVQIRDSRYDAVFHLTTAAEGAEAFYTCANNEARGETVEQAREIDKKTMEAWLGHPHHYVFGNEGDFEEKLRSLVTSVSRAVGLPPTSKSTTKHLLPPHPPSHWISHLESLSVKFEVFDIEKVYLLTSSSSDDSYTFVRRRSLNGVPSYGRTTVTPPLTPGGHPVELKRIITSREYNTLTNDYPDPDRHVILQKRISFIHLGQACQIHCYLSPRTDLSILHVQGGGDGGEVVEALGGGEKLEEGREGAWQVSLKKLTW